MKTKIKLIHKGFTLVELLVVISIIGILATLAIASYTGAQKQARDTQRKSDLKQYQSSLESYALNNNNFYPSYTTVSGLTSLCNALGTGACPDDPKSPTYAYGYISDGTGSGTATATTYIVWTYQENSSKYYLFCSNGKNGIRTSAPTSSACPL